MAVYPTTRIGQIIWTSISGFGSLGLGLFMGWQARYALIHLIQGHIGFPEIVVFLLVVGFSIYGLNLLLFRWVHVRFEKEELWLSSLFGTRRRVLHLKEIVYHDETSYTHKGVTEMELTLKTRDDTRVKLNSENLTYYPEVAARIKQLPITAQATENSRAYRYFWSIIFILTFGVGIFVHFFNTYQYTIEDLQGIQLKLADKPFLDDEGNVCFWLAGLDIPVCFYHAKDEEEKSFLLDLDTASYYNWIFPKDQFRFRMLGEPGLDLGFEPSGSMHLLALERVDTDWHSYPLFGTERINGQKIPVPFFINLGLGLVLVWAFLSVPLNFKWQKAEEEEDDR